MLGVYAMSGNWRIGRIAMIALLASTLQRQLHVLQYQAVRHRPPIILRSYLRPRVPLKRDELALVDVLRNQHSLLRSGPRITRTAAQHERSSKICRNENYRCPF